MILEISWLVTRLKVVLWKLFHEKGRTKLTTVSFVLARIPFSPICRVVAGKQPQGVNILTLHGQKALLWRLYIQSKYVGEKGKQNLHFSIFGIHIDSLIFYGILPWCQELEKCRIQYLFPDLFQFDLKFYLPSSNSHHPNLFNSENYIFIWEPQSNQDHQSKTCINIFPRSDSWHTLLRMQHSS